jgi:hypothetical protein
MYQGREEAYVTGTAHRSRRHGAPSRCWPPTLGLALREPRCTWLWHAACAGRAGDDPQDQRADISGPQPVVEVNDSPALRVAATLAPELVASVFVSMLPQPESQV